ncbi:rhodanese-like domain-containing protein [Marinobacterium halophilum]|uniref:Rhodanese-like domain-containing protein n=1 Tax=Marinobacterium halophilum TaxID=267374 RepID=A0A2P8EZF2_9GAMM|nr:rhodanese-like domain-containing protein [Marinobacterium halophilum]PSL14838.1 rhodanese-like domain-containing protein [Marinobacterium halophilum]
MDTRWLAAAVLGGVMMAPSVWAEGESRVMITPDLYSFKVMHDGTEYDIMRNQDPEHRIHSLYETTSRGLPQAMHPFAPHAVETLGEREFIHYMMQAQQDDSVMIVDTRTIGWHVRLTIPGARNYPYTMMDDEGDREWALDDFGVTSNAEGGYDFSQAKTLAMFCNGYWCGQTPAMIRKLLALGYPAEKLKYYRGGMQAWTSLGFTVIGDGAE